MKNCMSIKAKILNTFTRLYEDYIYNGADQVFTEPIVKCWFSTPNGPDTYARRTVIYPAIRKYLSWIPQSITLPRWLYFGIDNYPLGWKTKWGSYRFEYPPRWSIFIFGFSFNIVLKSPFVKTPDKWTEWYTQDDDSYWESILNFQNRYGLKTKEHGHVSIHDMEECLHSAIGDVGWYSDTVYTEPERVVVDASMKLPWKERQEKIEHLGTKYCYLRLRPEYLKSDWREQFYIQKSKLQEKHIEKTWL